jgi:hypothetical protein
VFRTVDTGANVKLINRKVTTEKERIEAFAQAKSSCVSGELLKSEDWMYFKIETQN